MKPPIDEMLTIAPDFWRAHDRQHRARHGREAEEIGVEHRAHVGVVAFLDRREIAVAGVVDEDIDAAEASLGRLDRGVDLLLLVDVEREREAVLVVARDNVVDLRLVARRHDDAIAALEQDDGEFPTESGRAAGDEPNGFGFAMAAIEGSAVHADVPRNVWQCNARKKRASLARGATGGSARFCSAAVPNPRAVDPATRI